MKKSCRQVVFDLIRNRKVISGKEIAKTTGFSAGAVSSAVSALMKEGFIVKEKFKSSTLKKSNIHGRSPLFLKIKPDYEFYIGCEIQNSHILVAVVDAYQQARIVRCFELPEPDQDLAETLEYIFRQVLQEVSFPKRVKGFGVCLPGSVDFHQGVIVHSPRVKSLTNYPLARILEERLHLPVVIENSARASGLAEVKFSQDKNLRNVIYIRIGKGIGSAIIIEGKLFRGSNDMGGEVGHIVVEDNYAAPLCTCGNRGCLETLASCPAMVRRANQLIQQGAHSCLESVFRDAPDAVKFERLVEAAAINDKVALIVFEETITYLIRALGMLINLLNPDSIILGGEEVKAKEFFLDQIKLRIKTKVITEVMQNLRIEFSHIGVEAGAFGVALLTQEKVHSILGSKISY